MAASLQVAVASLVPPSTSSPIGRRGRGRTIGGGGGGVGGVRCAAIDSKGSSKLPLPPINPKDPFLSKLASVAAASPESLLDRPASSDTPPYLDLFESPQLMATPAQIHTVAVGAAIGHACLLLASGCKGKRFMMPHAKAMIQQPRVPSSGLMPASDVLIRAKEVITNRDTLVKLLAKHTGNTVATVMRRPYYMDAMKAREFGVIDKILWRGQEKIMADAGPPEE